jgi:acetyl-CoA carboxylase biotin carboxyl carrier protein
MGNSKVSNDLSSLTEDHVRQLGRIIETLERSTFDFLQIEVGDMKVTVGKGNIPIEAAAPPRQAVAATAPAPAPTVSAPAPQTAPAPQAAASAHPGAVEIKAAIMGMFYAQPEPGAAPFVKVGASVKEDTTVGLVEVMKTFNAVTAGVRGKIVEVCVPNAQLVEYGQVLFRVVPE